MNTMKQEALKIIKKMPDSVTIEDIMYHLYVLEKVRKGRVAVEQNETITIEKLKKELQKW